jgi:hypothetical protein
VSGRPRPLRILLREGPGSASLRGRFAGPVDLVDVDALAADVPPEASWDRLAAALARACCWRARLVDFFFFAMAGPW